MTEKTSNVKYMPMRKYPLMLFLIMLSTFANAQAFLVKAVMRDVSDISASYMRRIDHSGEPCALIKLQMMDKLASVEGAEIVGDTPRFGTTTWLYVPHATESVTLLFDNHDPLTLQFNDYKIPSLQRLCTYNVVLTDKSGTSDPDHPTDAVAQYELALDYMHGRNGRAIDTYTAKTWLVKAAEQGCDMSQAYLGAYLLKEHEAYSNDNAVSQQKRQACFDEAIRWLEKAAKAGNTTAMFNLARAYINSSTTDNYKVFNSKGLSWAIKAAERGHTSGMEMAGDLLAPSDWYDYGITTDVEQAVKWYTKASSMGSSRASYQLGRLYQRGMYGLKTDKKKARHWYSISAAQGEKKALQRLNDPDLK